MSRHIDLTKEYTREQRREIIEDMNHQQVYRLAMDPKLPSTSYKAIFLNYACLYHAIGETHLRNLAEGLNDPNKPAPRGSAARDGAHHCRATERMLIKYKRNLIERGFMG